MFLLPEGQTGKAWELSKRQCNFGNRGALHRILFVHVFVFKWFRS